MIALAGCGSFPLPKVYVLGDPAPAASGVISEHGLPVVELKPVTVPDYLDSTDLLRRVGPNQVVASPTGRWGERVSLGIGRALAASLSRRLPGVVVENGGAYEASRRLYVNVERFDIDADGRCVLQARWRVTSVKGEIPAGGEEGTFEALSAARSDGAEAAAMSRATEDLAAAIAVSVKTALAQTPEGAASPAAGR
jgi:uncharacterized lipoprotein YmbA